MLERFIDERPLSVTVGAEQREVQPARPIAQERQVGTDRGEARLLDREPVDR